MEITVQDSGSINHESNHKSIKKTNGTSFADTLESAVNNSKTPQTNNKEVAATENNLIKDAELTGIPRIDSLPKKNKNTVLKAIYEVSRILGIDVYKHFNNDGTIDMKGILGNFKGHIKSCDMEVLVKSINDLHDNGLIDDENYIYALKWIQAKELADNVKLSSDNKENSIYNSLVSFK